MEAHITALVEELENKTAQLFDIREPNEWEVGHLAQASLVPLSDLKAGISPNYDKKLKTYIHCRSGVRVRNARPLLEAMGFSDVIELREGFATLLILGFERG